MTTQAPRDTRQHAEGQARQDERHEQGRYEVKPRPVLLALGKTTRGETGYMTRVIMNHEGQDTVEAQDAPPKQGDGLPLPPEATAPLEPEKKPAIERKPLDQQPPVMIVEDTVELAEVIQATVEGMGLKAEYATHGKIALERIKALSPHLILLDIGLPDISGWEMIKSIRELYQANPTANVPAIVVITAYGDPANRLIGKLQEIYSYLIKPFTPDQIERVVREALSLD